MTQLLAHLWGDYILQSEWMAQNKTKQSLAALIHALLYAATFLLLTRHWLALAVIVGTHFLIDRFRLARYAVWLKNGGPFNSWGFVSPTGYPVETPPWLAVWLLIIADNTLHLSINYAALRWL